MRIAAVLFLAGVFLAAPALAVGTPPVPCAGSSSCRDRGLPVDDGASRLPGTARPAEPHAYTLAFYLNRKGDTDEAVKTLEKLVAGNPGYRDAELLLGELVKPQRKP